MQLLEFRKDFIETVKSLAVTEGDFEQSSFVNLCAGKLEEAEEFEDFEPCYYEGIGRRNRRLLVHGFAFDDVDESVNLLVAQYSGTDEMNTLTYTDLGKLLERLRAFTEEAVSGRLHVSVDESSPCFGLAYQLFQCHEEISRFKFYVVTDSVLSNRVKDVVADSILGTPIEYSVWDISRFHRVFESKTGKEPLFIDFSQYAGKEIYCLPAGENEGEYKGYLCIIPGAILAEVYEQFGSRLLEGNVRSFLSTRGRVNKGIRNTILNEPEMFFAYNNGISATATQAQFKMTDSGVQLVSATDLQIVNGGQTTASILMGKLKDKRDLSKVYVQMKLSVVTPELADTMIPLIAKYANSQNQISDADFFSNHPFHVRIESLSRRLWAPSVGGALYETHWFYERARGQYLNEQSTMTASEQRKFLLQNPRNQQITKTDLAKYQFSWMGYPHFVSLGPQKNFKHFAKWVSSRWEKSDSEFNEAFFRNVVCLAILFKRTESLVSEQSWYQNSYRQNIVTYAIAKLAHMIGERFDDKVLDFRSIWSRQGLSDVMVAQLEKVSRVVFDIITTPEMGIQIVQEWCKKEQCWERVKGVAIDLVPGFESALTDKSEAKEVERESKAQQKLDNGIEAQVTVAKLGTEYWSKLRRFAQQNKIITQEEDNLVKLALRMDKGFIPTDKQCVKLLDIDKRVRVEGFAGQGAS